jgi:DNA-binding transcriptional regulator YdaS (Cro superfamily)
MAVRIQRNPKAVWRAIGAYGTQELMANALGVEQATVSEWARGNRSVPWHFCVKVETDTRRIAQTKRDPLLVVTCEELQPGLDWEAVLQLAVLRLGTGKMRAA